MIYIIDTNAWIDFSQNYPVRVFGGLWKKMARLVGDGRVQMPEQVKREIVTNRSELFELFKNGKNAFRTTTPDMIRSANAILAKHPCLTKHHQDEAADPFIIALAQKISGGFDSTVIVTQESQKKECRIPYVARQYGLKSVKLVELFELEGWRFD